MSDPAVRTENATAALAALVSGTRFEDLAPEVFECARDRIIDQIGVQLFGSTLPWSHTIEGYVAANGGQAACTVVGSSLRVPARDAAFINAVFGHSCELDDYGAAHAGCATVPVAFALGEAEAASGRDLVTAIVTGYEVMVRLNTLLYGGLGRRGYHSLTVLGVFGSAATAARLLRLSPEETHHALGIAGSFAGGTMEYDQSGGESKRLHAGLASRAGVEAALLARRGLTGPAAVLEGARGVGKVFADFDGDWSSAWDGFGSGREIVKTGLKLHPVLARIASALDIADELTAGAALDANAVEAVEVFVNDGTIRHGGSIRRPADSTSAQMSLPFALALRLATGTASLQDFMDEARWSDPAILALVDRIAVLPDVEAVGPRIFSARLRVTLKSGEVLEGAQTFPKGSARNALTRAEVLRKFRSLASTVVPDERVEAIVASLMDIESADDIGKRARLHAA